MSTKRGLTATAVILVLQATVTGCNNYEPVPKPTVERNQAPRELYKLTISLPAEIASAPLKRARANYSIKNRRCIPMDHTMALGGTRPHFTERIDIDFHRTGDAEYTGYLYGDAFVSADYYGLGVCNWTLESVDALIGLKHDLSLGVSGHWVLEGSGAQNKVCPKKGHSSLAIWGCLDPTAMAPGEELKYFEVTVKTEKEQ